MTCPHVYSDGAYVLGALTPAERSAYEAHLAQCSACAAGVAQLAVLPGLLGRVSEDALRPIVPEPPMLERLVEKVAALRRRQSRVRRWRFASALAGVALLAVAGTMALMGLPASDAVPQMLAMHPLAADTQVTAMVGHDRSAGGTKVWMVCRYPDASELPRREFRLVATATDGSTDQLGSWWAGPGDEVDLAGLTRFATGELARIELQGIDGDAVLVYDVP